MTKRVFIIHGWGGYPEHGWYLWLKYELEKKGFKAFVPQMPDTETPKIKPWTSKIKEIVGEPDEDTYFVGHSIGCQAILRYLETINKIKIGGIILVAPWMHLDKKTIEEEGEEVKEIARPWMETPIKWENIKNTMPHHTLKGVVCKGARVLDAQDSPHTKVCGFVKNLDIKNHTENFVCILSDNDPYVPLSNKNIFKKELNAKIIIEHNKGHFTEDDNIKELPVALEEIKRMSQDNS